MKAGARGLALALTAVLTAGAVLAGPVSELPETDAVGDMGAFSVPADEAAARRSINDGERRFQAVDAAAAARIAAARGGCDSAGALGPALSGLNAVERDASRYVALAAAAPLIQDREAAMDVVEELDAFALDGYLRGAEAYEISGCLEAARKIYREILDTYTGAGYKHWRSRAAERLKALRAGHPLIRR